MKLINIIMNFIEKAKQEAQRDYHLNPAVKAASPSEERVKNESGQMGWIGIDLDGTLAKSDTYPSHQQIGSPIPKMLRFVNQLINEGNRVKIFTARATDPEQIPLVKRWLKENGLPNLEITNIKDYAMILLYDDRAVQVITNTGEIVESKRG